jgi:hypothetical protein
MVHARIASTDVCFSDYVTSMDSLVADLLYLSLFGDRFYIAGSSLKASSKFTKELETASQSMLTFLLKWHSFSL